MPRVRNAPLAILALLASAGVAAAASLPDAAAKGLAIAAEHAGKTVPAGRPAADDTLAPAATPTDEGGTDAVTPDAANHGATVAAAAQAEDTTPDTNHGADVSAVARDNHGQATAAEHKPADAGKPDDAGKPHDVGPPEDPGKPDGAGKPADPGQPSDPGRP